MNDVIVAEGLYKSFVLSKKQQRIEKTTVKIKNALSGLSFTARQGEIFGLLGANGAGKTTTLRIIASLITPDKGDVMVHGVSVVENPEIVRNKLGFLTSELKLEDFFTPDYLFDFFASLHGMDATFRDERKAALFKRFGVDEFAGVKIANLSTGMKQKVSLVISIIHDPDIIVFDEPTNGLDIFAARELTDFLVELRDAGKTIIVSTHIFSLAEKICDRIGIIADGRMVRCDSLKNLTEGQNLEDVFFRTVSGNGAVSEKE